MSSDIHWYCRAFNEQSLTELYDNMVLRQEVFVVEQECAFLDADGMDQHCIHLFGYSDSSLVAYSRLVPRGVAYTECSIGRVVTAPSHRGLNLGRELMQRSIAWIEEHWGAQAIKIGAQQRLEKFYQSLGFEISGEPYMEDGILHVHMIRPAAQ